MTTRYFDGNKRQIGEINGDNVLKTSSYNAASDLRCETLYMGRRPAAAHDPASLPAGSGESRTTTRECDLGGRLTRVISASAFTAVCWWRASRQNIRLEL